MKQTVTDMNDPSEPTVYFSSCIEHYMFGYFFQSLPVDSSSIEDVGNLSEINNYIVVPFVGFFV